MVLIQLLKYLIDEGNQPKISHRTSQWRLFGASEIDHLKFDAIHLSVIAVNSDARFFSAHFSLV